MFPFTKTVPTTKKSSGKNTCEFLVIHHTAGWTFEGNVNYLSQRNRNPFSGQNQVSCPFVVWPAGETAKIGDPIDIQWHCGASSWKGRSRWNSMNAFAIGIEIVWPPFTLKQQIAVRKLIGHLRAVFNIPAENVLRHADIAPKRKTDVDPSFYAPQTWKEFVDSIPVKKV